VQQVLSCCTFLLVVTRLPKRVSQAKHLTCATHRGVDVPTVGARPSTMRQLHGVLRKRSLPMENALHKYDRTKRDLKTIRQLFNAETNGARPSTMRQLHGVLRKRSLPMENALHNNVKRGLKTIRQLFTSHTLRNTNRLLEKILDGVGIIKM
jgi:hypothetical protein